MLSNVLKYPEKQFQDKFNAIKAEDIDIEDDLYLIDVLDFDI